MSHPTWQSIFMYVISDFDTFEALIDLPDQIFKNCTQKPQLFFLIISLFCLGRMFAAFSIYLFFKPVPLCKFIWCLSEEEIN
jgi:hypothetical protein